MEKTAFYDPAKQRDVPVDYMGLNPPITPQQLGCRDDGVNTSAVQFFDAWKNQIASIGANNSIQQHTTYLFERISYQECAALATDPLIHKAVEVLVNEMFSHGGKIVSAGIDSNKFDIVMCALRANTVVKEAARKAFEFGGCFIYIDTSDKDLEQQLYINDQTTSETRLLGFRVLEPWQFAPAAVNTYNPLKDDYMVPSLWWVMGAGMVHKSRLIPVEFFPLSYLYKPMFNYLGLPLSFYMKDYVSTADTIRQALGDIFLRFSTNIVKTTAHKVSNQEGYDRVKHINETRNNLGTIVLSEDEDFIQVQTPLSGLDDIQRRAYELIVATSYAPTTKLLGVEPSGFNSTGEHTMRNYYDTIAGFQNNCITPVMELIARIILCFKLGMYADVKYEWAPLGQPTDKEAAEIKNLQADYINKLVSTDVITAEEGLVAIQTEDFGLKNVDVTSRMEEPAPDDEALDVPTTDAKDDVSWKTLPNGEHIAVSGSEVVHGAGGALKKSSPEPAQPKPPVTPAEFKANNDKIKSFKAQLTELKKELATTSTNTSASASASPSKPATNAKTVFGKKSIEQNIENVAAAAHMIPQGGKTDTTFNSYTSEGYLGINNSLRGLPKAGKMSDKNIATHIGIMDATFAASKPLKEAVTVYRGVPEETYKALQMGEAKGFTDPAYTSTSASAQAATNFSRGGAKFLMKITVPKGAKLLGLDNITTHLGEEEFLLPRDTTFKIIGSKKIKKPNGSTYTILDVEAVERSAK